MGKKGVPLHIANSADLFVTTSVVLLPSTTSINIYLMANDMWQFGFCLRFLFAQGHWLFWEHLACSCGLLLNFR